MAAMRSYASLVTCAEGDATRDQFVQHGGTAVRLQFDHVLAGIAGGRGEVQRDAIVDRLAFAIAEAHVMGLAWNERAVAQGFGDRTRARPRKPHDADAPRAGSGGDGGDGVAVGVGAHSGRGGS